MKKLQWFTHPFLMETQSSSRQNLEDAYADLLITKLTNVMDDASHPLHERLPPAVTDRYLSSFVPQAIRIHNANFQRGTISIDM